MIYKSKDGDIDLSKITRLYPAAVIDMYGEVAEMSLEWMESNADKVKLLHYVLVFDFTPLKEEVKNKQTDYKSDGEYGYDQDPIAPAMPGQKKESPFAPVGSSKKPKKPKKQKINPNSDLARLAAEQKAKKKKKRAGTGNHPLNK